MAAKTGPSANTPAGRSLRQVVMSKKRSKYRKEKALEFVPTQQIKYNLTESDRVDIAFEVEKPSFKVRNFRVLYEIEIDGEWMWIIRYDGWHGLFHQHIRLSLDEKIQERVPQTYIKDYNKAVGWAQKDINERWKKYREQFLEKIEKK